MNRITKLTMAALALAVPAAGQGVMVAGTPASQTMLERQAVEKQAVERARATVESRVTPGAPYSAEAVTESLQVLSDGNRISRKTTTRIYRDSEGRTRREQLSRTGEPQSVSISDPVAGTAYVLNPAEHTASRAGMMISMPGAAMAAGSVYTVRTREGSAGATPSEMGADAKKKREAETLTAVAAVGGAVHAGAVAYPAEAVSLPRTVSLDGLSAAGTTSKEELGQQTIEGVLATGTRTTTTIPAGAIGNDQPLIIVSEQWFSRDLQALVMTKHNDPRTGETTYRLTNIVQTEPSRSLFEVPSDYSIKENAIRRQPPVQP